RPLRLRGEGELAHQDFDTIGLQLIASLEQYSEHPLGRAVVKRAEAKGIDLLEASAVEICKGIGITGMVAGHHVFIGNRRLAEEQSTRLPKAVECRTQILETEGRTVALFGWDKQVRGLLAFGDRTREDAAKVIAGLKRRGIQTMIVSGDAHETTAFVAS